MYTKLLLFASLSMATVLSAATASMMMPPMVPTISKQHTASKHHIPIKKREISPLGSCSMVPPMIINLPPPLEKAVQECKNERGMPTKEFAEKQLSKLFKKKIKVKSIEIVKKFNQLYKVTYVGGVIFCNKSVDAFVR